MIGLIFNASGPWTAHAVHGTSGWFYLSGLFLMVLKFLIDDVV